jgi:hypothetical protein
MLNIEQIFYPTRPETATLGYNSFNATVASRQFSGRVVGCRPVGMDAIPPRVTSGVYGPVELSVMLPLAAIGTNEPLVVTGRSGAGDFIYLRYLDGNHLSLGFDHWSVGGVVSPPIEVSYGQAHRFGITMGSLYPEGSAARGQRILRVLLDGKVALEGVRDTYPSTPDDIEVATNHIGGSTCGPQFTGRVLSLQRPSVSPP